MFSDFKKRIFGNELKYLEEVLATDFRASQGSIMMKRLEESFAKKFETQFGISFVNGTATLHAALEAAGIGPGDEVIVPPLTMSATTFAVLQAMATPVFADVDPRTFQISPLSIQERTTSRTKAIIPVALYGLCPDLDPILHWAKQKNLFVLEDNAQCFLGKYKGKIVGCLGDASSFSFQSSKHMTCGEGGMVLTNSATLAEKIRKVQSLGYAGVGATKGKITKQDIQDPNYNRHVTMGWNYRLSELCSAVALAQLENLDELVARRREVALLFSEVVEGIDWLIPQQTPPDCTHSYWTYVVKLEHPRCSWTDFRNRFMELGGHGIYSAWKLTYLEPMFLSRDLLRREQFISKEQFQTYQKGLCPIAEELQPKLLQFRTNYWDIEEAKKQVQTLKKLIHLMN